MRFLINVKLEKKNFIENIEWLGFVNNDIVKLWNYF